MTEAEWLALNDPQKMLLAIRDRVSDRRLRHFAIACACRVRDRVTDSRGLAALEFTERYVDVGVARRKGRGPVAKGAKQACAEAYDAHFVTHHPLSPADRLIVSNALQAVEAPLVPDAWFAAHLASGFAANVVAQEWCRDNQGQSFQPDNPVKAVELRQQVPLLLDIFGRTFRPPQPLAPAVLAWNGGLVGKLAQAIYDEEAFDRLGVLADALEEAGCADTELLGHLRGPGPHARGCWAVDALRGKD